MTRTLLGLAVALVGFFALAEKVITGESLSGVNYNGQTAACNASRAMAERLRPQALSSPPQSPCSCSQKDDGGWTCAQP